MTVSRRQFLTLSGLTLGGVVVYGSLPTALWLYKNNKLDGEQADATEYQPGAHQWAMIVDIEKCIGCRRCLYACEQENHVPHELELHRTWLEKYTITVDGSLKAELVEKTEFGAEENDTALGGFFVPKLCQQCANPPCVSVCPLNATFRTDDGVILMDNERCIGCKYCVVACPYGARFLNPETMVVDKCTFCYHRITKGLKPACVQACPTGARSFGNLMDPEDPVRQRLLDESLQILKPSLGTKPRVYYTGLREGVR